MNRHKAIIIYNSVPYFKSKFLQKGIPTFNTYKELPLYLKVFRKISLKVDLFKTLWYDGWKNIINEIDTVIIFSTNPLETVDAIHTLNPNVRIIFWYWNPILEKGIKPMDISDEKCEKWSFDEKDCEKFRLKRNTSFYFDNIKLPVQSIHHDVVFVGVDKGRRNDLNILERHLVEKGLKTNFYIVDDSWNSKRYTDVYKPISYEEYLILVARSKAILDFVQRGQSGLTLRPFESMFLNKKLITNDVEIVNQDFYNPNNIFVIGLNSMDKINEFINSPFIRVPESIKQKYDVKKWLDRFFIED